MHLCLKLLCAKVSAPNRFFCARDFSLTVRDFWRADELRGDEKGWSVLGWDENSWEELTLMTCEKRWDEMRRDEKSRDEVRRAHVIWRETKCRVRSACVKCEVQGVKRALWSVRKVFAWRCIAPGSWAGHVLGQHLCNSFAQSTHARAWLAHGACKFYRWESSYISLRQLPPCLVRVLLVVVVVVVVVVECSVV